MRRTEHSVYKPSADQRRDLTARKNGLHYMAMFRVKKMAQMAELWAHLSAYRARLRVTHELTAIDREN